ncbi:MAG: hypothetical protein ACYDGW_07925 [Vulcanimicrobiaceae bacterium]
MLESFREGQLVEEIDQCPNVDRDARVEHPLRARPDEDGRFKRRCGTYHWRVLRDAIRGL